MGRGTQANIRIVSLRFYLRVHHLLFSWLFVCHSNQQTTVAGTCINASICSQAALISSDCCLFYVRCVWVFAQANPSSSLLAWLFLLHLQYPTRRKWAPPIRGGLRRSMGFLPPQKWTTLNTNNATSCFKILSLKRDARAHSQTNAVRGMNKIVLGSYLTHHLHLPHPCHQQHCPGVSEKLPDPLCTAGSRSRCSGENGRHVTKGHRTRR